MNCWGGRAQAVVIEGYAEIIFFARKRSEDGLSNPSNLRLKMKNLFVKCTELPVIWKSAC